MMAVRRFYWFQYKGQQATNFFNDTRPIALLSEHSTKTPCMCLMEAKGTTIIGAHVCQMFQVIATLIMVLHHSSYKATKEILLSMQMRKGYTQQGSSRWCVMSRSLSSFPSACHSPKYLQLTSSVLIAAINEAHS